MNSKCSLVVSTFSGAFYSTQFGFACCLYFLIYQMHVFSCNEVSHSLWSKWIILHMYSCIHPHLPSSSKVHHTSTFSPIPLDTPGNNRHNLQSAFNSQLRRDRFRRTSPRDNQVVHCERRRLRAFVHYPPGLTQLRSWLTRTPLDNGPINRVMRGHYI